MTEEIYKINDKSYLRPRSPTEIPTYTKEFMQSMFKNFFARYHFLDHILHLLKWKETILLTDEIFLRGE